MKLSIRKKFKINDHIQEFLKRNSLNLCYSIIIALFIVVVCTFSNKSFFFFDDAQTELLPYLRQSGKAWLKGEIPFIIKKTFIGQNLMIDLNRPIFLPQNMIMSIIAAKIQSLVTIANIFAFLNTMILAFFSFKLCEALSLNKTFKIVFAFLVSINPVYLYFYLASWWSYAYGYTWFMAGLASIFLLRKNFSMKYLILYIFTVYNLFATGIPQFVLGYLFCILIFILENIYDKKYKGTVFFILINIGIFMIVLNIYAEYIISSSLLLRLNVFSNGGNFLVPSLNTVVMTFNPVYYDWFNRFGGYLMTYIPIGYSSIFILFVICFVNQWKNLFKDKNIKFIFLLVLIFFIFSQTPADMVLMKHPLRYLQFFSVLITIFSLYVINVTKLNFSKKRVQVFIGIVILSSVLSFFKLETDQLKILFANIIFVILTLSYLYIVCVEEKFSFIPTIIYSVMMLLLMLFVQPSVDGILSFPGLQDKINKENDFSSGGYTLSLTNGKDPKENIEDIHSAHFLLYNIKSVNGDDPIGNKNLIKLLRTENSQAIFNNPDETIINLSSKYNNGNVCYFDLMNITSIPIWKDKLNDNMKKKLESCGYFSREVNSNSDVIYYVKDRRILGNVSYASNGITVNKVLEDKNNIEKYSITSTSNGVIILSKVWWRGYKAYVNGKKVNISNEKGLMKLDNIPSGLNNAVLEIKYFPASWKVTLWLGLIGIIEIILTLVYFKKRKDEMIEKTDDRNI